MILSNKASEEQLMEMLNLDIIELETEPLNHPRTVCMAKSCVKYHPTSDGSACSVEYIKHCHQHCYLKGIPEEIVGDQRLKLCQAIDKETLKCSQCGCFWDKHLYITYVQKQIVTHVTTQHVEMLISGKRNERQQIEAFIKMTEELRKEHEEELRKIIEVSVKLGQYLTENAILPFNDVMGR
uniref:DUF8206 domain-containing protein n=1 Tax=Strigamia maritima TaxID=126957 RepID=T1IQV4_STRMM